MKPSYEMGQIVYILSETSESIVPGIIIEEIMVKTLQGNSVSWKIRIGPEEKNQIVDSSQIKQKIYGSLEEISKVMKVKLDFYLQNLIKTANNKAVSWYGEDRVKIKQLQVSQEKLSISELESSFTNNAAIPITQEDLREKLKNSFIASDEEMEAEKAYEQQ